MDELSHQILLSNKDLLEEDDQQPDFDLSVGYDVHCEAVTTRFTKVDGSTNPMKGDEADDRTASPETTPLAPRSHTSSAADVVRKLKLPFYSSSQVSWFSIALLCILLFIYVLNQADRLVLPVVIPAGLRCSKPNISDACLEVPLNGTPPLNVSEPDNRTASTVTSCIVFSDWEQGLLTGPAFTVIYVLAGLPLAYLADWKSRPLVLVLGLTFWSVMVLLTGFTNAFWQLLVLRVFLGIGEVCQGEGMGVLREECVSGGGDGGVEGGVCVRGRGWGC